jgi:aromatic-L-amino-acid decarboxylase
MPGAVNPVLWQAGFWYSRSMMHPESNTPTPVNIAGNLDPRDWPAFRRQGQQMLSDMLDYIEHIRARPVWQPIPDATRQLFHAALPAAPRDLADVHASVMQDILPHVVGNTHPRFMGWVHGGGTPVGLLADMLAGGLNANVGGRDQMPLEVEAQVVRWMRQLFAFPDTASGVFVTGTSMANYMGLLVALTHALGASYRRTGLGEKGAALVAYCSAATHNSVARAMSMAGLGSNALRRIPVNAAQQMDARALQRQIHTDRAAGRRPFLVVGSAGTVDVGAVDPLPAIADIAAQESIWFHVDGAFAALGMLAPDIAPMLAGIERADSLAFDFHKWGQVQYDAGFLLVRDGARHRAAFAASADYLQRDARGLASGDTWPCDLGPDLSRSFRALKTWMTFTVLGTEHIGAAISQCCRLARYLRDQVEASPCLELLAPVALNIVCFRFVCADADRINREIVADLHEAGIAVPSTTVIDGHLAIRAAIVNHRTTDADIDILVAAVIKAGSAYCKEPHD